MSSQQESTNDEKCGDDKRTEGPNTNTTTAAINTKKSIIWSDDMIWASVGTSDTAVKHPAFLSIHVKIDGKNDDSDHSSSHDDGDDNNMVWIKWAATGGVTQVLRSQISLELPPRSRRRPERHMPEATETPRKRKKSSKHDETKEEAIKSSPLSPFLMQGVNCARHSSYHGKRRLVRQHHDDRSSRAAAAAGPLDAFLKDGVNSSRNSSRDFAVSSRCARRRLQFASDAATTAVRPTTVLSGNEGVMADTEATTSGSAITILPGEQTEVASEIPQIAVKQEDESEDERAGKMAYGYETE